MGRVGAADGRGSPTATRRDTTTYRLALVAIAHRVSKLVYIVVEVLDALGTQRAQ
jgi:hypothetical protein